jgi:hypothetical protein
LLRHAPSWAAVGLLVTAFALLKTLALHPALSDENLYFYAGWALWHGSLPYRDFFLAHPPLGVVLDAPWVAWLAPDIHALKLIPLAWTLAAGLCVFVHGRAAKGELEGVLSVALFLTSYAVLSTSSFHTGADVVTALLAAGLVARTSNHRAAVGGLAGAAMGTRLYAIPMAVLLVFLEGKRTARATVLACGLVVLATVGLPALLLGRDFTNAVMGFQLTKQARDGWPILLGGVADAPLVFSAALLGIPAAVLRVGSWERRWAGMGGLGLLGVLVAPRSFPYHLLPCLVPLALLGGSALAESIRLLGDVVLARASAFRLLCVLALAGVLIPLAEARFRGPSQRPYVGITRYVASEMTTLPAATRMAGHITAHGEAQDELMGSSGLAPLLALMTGVPVALTVVDSNPQRFQGPTEVLQQVLAELEARPPRWAASTDPGGWLALPEARDFLQRHYRVVLEEEDPLYGRIRLLERITP